MKPVLLSRRTMEMDHYAQDPFCPHPVFPQWSPWDVYPYPYYGRMRKYLTRRKYFMPTLENDYLRVTVAADIGGRMWDVYDKIGKRHVANFTSDVRTYNAGFGLNYTTGGIECNYPLAHACTTNRAREVSLRRNPDGSAEIVCSEYERIWRTRWSVAYVLHPDRSYVQLRVRVYNRTPFDSRYMYWNNCGFYLTPRTQYIFPEAAGAMHGMEDRTFSWPKWRHRDLSFFGQVPPEMLGLYMLDADEPFFGYYNHDEHHGLVHYGDLADLPGKKTWTWGTDPDGCDDLRKTHHGCDVVYGECQSGRIVIQEHLDRVPPETEFEWSEIWYPVRDLGAYNAAGPGAALRAEIVTSDARRSLLRVAAMANGRFPRARLVVTSDGLDPVAQPFPVDPLRPAECEIVLPGLAGPDQHTQVVLQDQDGLILARGRLRKPNTRDCWTEVYDLDRPLKPVGTEELFIAAEKKARDWGNHDDKENYAKALALDPDFSPARRELGKACLLRGEFGDGIAHLQAALRRDEDSFETRYFLGMAHLLNGEAAPARKAFEMANRYDCEARSLVRLAELCMREEDWHHALKHLDRLAAAHPRLTRPRGLRAACLRRLGRSDAAAREIASARAIDAQDPFLQFEQMFIAAGAADARKVPKKALAALLDQVRREEPALLEAAYDYFAAHLFEEVAAVTRLIPAPGPLALLTQAYALDRLGRAREARAVLRRACAADPVYQHPWGVEMFAVLDWARAQLPDHPRPLFLLGTLLMACRRTDEAVALWKKAADLGEKHALLFAGLGFYHARVAKDMRRALDWFRKAESADRDDLYVIHEIATALNATGKPADVVRYLESRRKAVEASPVIAYDLLNACLALNRYDAFDRLCARLDFRHNWQLAGPHSLWLQRGFQEALQLIEAGKPERALAILEPLDAPPEHLGHFNRQNLERDRRWYHIGRCHEKLGRPDAARQAWEECLRVPHFTGYETAYWYREWTRRYYQALALMKLGRATEADAIFDAMELLAHTPEMPLAAKRNIMQLVERGRFAPDALKDPLAAERVHVETRAEA